MKKNLMILMLSALGVGSLTTSCTDLSSDKYFDDRKTLTTVFTDKTQTQEWLAYAYSFLRGANQDVTSKGRTAHCFADDMYYGDRDSQYGEGETRGSYNALKLGNYGENWNQEAWYYCYKGIYQASVFIHNVDQNTEMTAEDRIDYKGHARFVRAYYYWLLLRRYGPVPIMPDEGVDYTKSYEEIATARSTYEEVAQYIATEMEQAAKEIQFTKRDPENIVRPTKGAALATRALAYIYAASPLANGQLQNGQHPAGVTDNIAKELTNKDGSQLLSTTYDESKWARAAAACKDVMDLGVYELYHAPFSTTASQGTPATVTPPADGNFSEKNWPDGWKNIDPYVSYRNLFDG